MYAKFSLLLTLLVFVDINVIKVIKAAAKETNTSNTKKLVLPIEIENAKTELEARSTLFADEATTALPMSEEEEAAALSGEEDLTNDDDDDDDDEPTSDEGRGFAGYHVDGSDSARPLKNMLRGIYKSYKSTFMGTNGTSAEYKKRLIKRLNAAATLNRHSTTARPTTTTQQNEDINKINERLKQQTLVLTSTKTVAEAEAAQVSTYPPSSPTHTLVNETLKVKLLEKQRKRKRKNKRAHSNANKRAKDSSHLNIVNEEAHEINNNNNSSVYKHSMNSSTSVNSSSDSSGISLLAVSDELPDKHKRYTIGPGVNMSFDMLNDIVNVNLDGDNLREIMRGRWLTDNTEEGRGKKYDMVTKVLPLFVLPFLIQSAIVPFLVTKLKLLLVKSILIGKLAIFLLIISAIKNSNNKMVQSYEVAPSYWAGEPSRRSELAAAAATSAAYNGYRVEGKPAAWIN